MSTKLSARLVRQVFYDCLCTEDENTGNAVKIEGIMTTVFFNPQRLESHKAEIEGMLDELPTDFKKSERGGMSFLLACLDKNGNQWTQLHETMEKLFQLGMAIDKVELLSPRTTWWTLPGEMPYYAVK